MFNFYAKIYENQATNCEISRIGIVSNLLNLNAKRNNGEVDNGLWKEINIDNAKSHCWTIWTGFIFTQFEAADYNSKAIGNL